MRFGSNNIARGILGASHILRGKAQVLNPGVTPAAGTISIFSGDGYAGSVYRSGSSGGLWYADENSTGVSATSYTMVVGNEGRSITYRRGAAISNAIKMWMPNHEPSIKGWFSAQSTGDFVLQTPANTVSTWINKISGFNAMQSTTTRRPIYTVDGLATGYPAVVANGTSQMMVINTVLAAGDQTVMAVMKTADTKGSTTTSWYSTPGIWGAEHAGAVSDFGWGIGGGIPYYGATNTTRANGTTLVNTNTPMIIGYTRGNFDGEVKHYLNGLQNGPATKLTAGNRSSVTNTALFCSNATTGSTGTDEFLSGALSEIIIFSSLMSPVIRNKVEGYLAWRWGQTSLLPVDHPYKTAPPAG